MRTPVNIEALKRRYREDPSADPKARIERLNSYFLNGPLRVFFSTAAAGVVVAGVAVHSGLNDLRESFKTEIEATESIDDLGQRRDAFNRQADIFWMNGAAQKHHALTLAAYTQARKQLSINSPFHLEYPDQGNIVMAIPVYPGPLDKPTKLALDSEELAKNYKNTLSGAMRRTAGNQLLLPFVAAPLEAGALCALLWLRRRRESHIDFLKLHYGDSPSRDVS